MSKVPVWVTGGKRTGKDTTPRSSGRITPRGRPITSFGAGRPEAEKEQSRSNSGKRASASDMVGVSRAKLGRTSGLMAVGAWSARMEIASMLESGVSAAEILDAIKKGEESEAPIRSVEGPSQRIPGERMQSSRSSPAAEKSQTLASEYREIKNSSSPSTISRNTDRSSRDTPRWISDAPFADLPFAKKAELPQEVNSSENEPVPTSPQADEGDSPLDEVESLNRALTSMDMEGLFGSFEKKADPPPAETTPLRSKESHIPVTLPSRRNPLEAEKLHSFRVLCRKLFDDLVILRVSLDILESVVPEKEVDEAKFCTLTDPRSAGTGLRYARLLDKYLSWIQEDYPGGIEAHKIFSLGLVEKYILGLIDGKVGFKTPLSLVYALIHFSDLFGFSCPGARHPRNRKLAMDYSKKSPESRQAPHLSVALLNYLEKAVLDESRSKIERITLGKLRVCSQASIRHSDLAGTELVRLEWCRMVGGKEVLGLRARAGHTKSGPRPWAAAWLGVNAANDRWLFKWAELLLDSHGSTWKTHKFVGCAHDGGGGFRFAPPTIQEDVLIVKRALLKDLETGRVEVPLSKEEVHAFRWHSCKNTMPTFMSHFGIKTRTIRFQGAWKKATESMVDLYLREAQTLVIQAQIQVLDQLRRGVALKVLEGESLDQIPSQPSWESAQIFATRTPPGADTAAAAEVMAAAVLCHKDPESGELVLDRSKTLDLRNLKEEFKERGTDDISVLDDVVDREARVKTQMDPALEAEMMVEMEEPMSSGEDSDASDADPSRADMDLHSAFLVIPEGNGRLHKPKWLSAGPEPLAVCGSKCKSGFAILDLDEKWGKYSLCGKCFGPERGCALLCDYVEKKSNGKKLRCGRRCSPIHVREHIAESE